MKWCTHTWVMATKSNFKKIKRNRNKNSSFTKKKYIQRLEMALSNRLYNICFFFFENMNSKSSFDVWKLDGRFSILAWVWWKFSIHFVYIIFCIIMKWMVTMTTTTTTTKMTVMVMPCCWTHGVCIFLLVKFLCVCISVYNIFGTSFIFMRYIITRSLASDKCLVLRR